MMQARIVTDSVADVPESLARALDITVVPCIVRFGDKTYRDKIDLSMAQFYEYLAASPVMPTTSQPAIGAFEEVYRELAQETDQIYSIHVIGRLSGTFNAASAAAQNVRGPEIRVVDSHQVSMAYGWLTIHAARAAQEGRDLAEIDELIQDELSRAHLIAALDTLEYARRGGRLGRAAVLAGTLLNVKPIVSVQDGGIQPLENVRTSTRALERLVTIASSSGPFKDIAVMHAGAPEVARRLRDMLLGELGQEGPAPDQVLVAETGPVIGAHSGPGAVGLAWVNR